MASCSSWVWNNQAISRKILGRTCCALALEEPFTGKNAQQNEKEMKINETISGLPLNRALDKIINYAIASSAPVLIVKEDNLDIEYSTRSFFKNRTEVYYVQLGKACPMSYIGQEIRLCLNKTHKVAPGGNHLLADNFIRNRIKELSKPPVIVIDNCHLLVFRKLFNLIGLINKLDGLARFIFLLSETYYEEFNYSKQTHLYYFKKIIDKVFWLEV
jgi:hypothetical protein